MPLFLDHTSPIPLFHQIAEALKHRIATGVLAKGEHLPGVREAARLWQVHFHTVRRAYQALAEEGFVEMGQGRPTLVLGQEGGVIREDLQKFLVEFLRKGQSVHGLSPDDLIRCLATCRDQERAPVVHMVECTDAQASALACEIQDRWGVETHAWTLDRSGEPPPGLIVATFFHFQEVRQRWPRRLGDIHFVALHPDSGLPERVRARLGRIPERVLLVERETSMAENVASDMRTVFLPCGIHVEPHVMHEGQSAFDVLDSGEACLFAPRVWGDLPPDAKGHALAFEACYRIRHADLEALGRSTNSKESRQ